MKKKVLAMAFCIVLAVSVISVSACKKKEPQKPVPQVPLQPVPQTPIGPVPQMPVQPSPQAPMPMTVPMGQTKVVVPDSVKGKWSAVKIIVEDKITKESREYTVNLDSDFKIPNSNLKVHVGDFLPDFKMDGFTLTSASNDPSNPAVGIRVWEGDKQIFPTPGKNWGWLFSKMPSVHPLKHSRYSIVLKEGVPKKG